MGKQVIARWCRMTGAAAVIAFATHTLAGNGDCCQANGSPGCEDDGCETAVCTIDSFCCEVLWDSICAQQADLLCEVCQVGSGGCCEANGTPGCNNLECQDKVCAVDPFCCTISWDAICAEQANELCTVCGGDPGDCCVPNGTPGCNDPDCEAAVCAVDAFCCETEWDTVCADEAEEVCAECVPPPPVCPGEGDCCSDNGTPGCDDPACCELICAQDSFCCETSWDTICAEAAAAQCEGCAAPSGACCIDQECSQQPEEVCLAQGGTYLGDGEPCMPGVCADPDPCPGRGDCCEPNGSPGCEDADCCELICAQDDFCCDTSWDAICADAALEQCRACAPPDVCPGEGSCCVPNGTPGCDVADCCELICAQDDFCCEIEWDQVCVDAAVEAAPCGSIFCDPPPGPCPGEGACCEDNGTPGCDDIECCEVVCGTDPFCCDLNWDEICADAALVACDVCQPEPDPCPEDISGDGVIDSADLNGLLFAFGESGDGDVDGDGDTDSADLNMLLFLFGTVCPK